MKKLLMGLLIIMVGLSAIGCSSAHTEPAAERTINIGVMPDVESVPFIIAQKNSYYEEEGVKVNIQHFSSAKDRDSALQSGKLDGVITDVLAVVFANEGGIELKIIARNDGNIELMAGKDSGISSLEELQGKDIGLSTNTIMEYSADKMLAKAGLNPGEVNKVAIPPLPTRLEMLQGGKVQAAILPEPLAGLAVKNGARVLSSTDEMGQKAGAIAFTGQVLQDNPQEIQAVFRAYNKAVAYLNQEATSADLNFIIEEQGFPTEIKDSIQLPEYQPAAPPDKIVFSDVVKWMQEKDLIKGFYAYEDLVDETILR